MYTYTHICTLELPFSDALAWRSQGQGGGNVCMCERDTHTVFVPLRRRSCHVSLWQMTPVGKKSAHRFCFRFRPAASLLLLLSNRVAFNGTVARSAACGIFIHRNKRRTHVTDQAANSQKKHRVPPDKETYSKRGFRSFAKKSSKCAHKTKKT